VQEVQRGDTSHQGTSAAVWGCQHVSKHISRTGFEGDTVTCRWNHFTNAELKNNHDDLLRAEIGFPEVSFVFQYISH
jgi:hypothetical protein